MRHSRRKIRVPARKKEEFGGGRKEGRESIKKDYADFFGECELRRRRE